MILPPAPDSLDVDPGADAPLVVMAPIGFARRPTPVAVVVAAALLAAVVGFFAVLAAIHRPAAPPPPPDLPPRFGPGTRERVDRLRDRAVAGLLSLRAKEGDFTTREGPGVDPAERKEATAFGVLGLTIARRLGSQQPGLDAALRGARSMLLRPAKARAGDSTSRGLRVSALATSLLALVVGGDVADRKHIEDGTVSLLALTEPGPPIQGWPQGIAARAYAAILDAGRGDLLGPDPRTVVPVWDNLGESRDGADQRVSEALALAIRAAPGSSKVAEEIFATVDADPIEWNGEQTDLTRWTLRAFLAARVNGGESWFRRVLGPLEQAVGEGGRVEGEVYGYPVARTALVLAILWEGVDVRPPAPR